MSELPNYVLDFDKLQEELASINSAPRRMSIVKNYGELSVKIINLLNEYGVSFRELERVLETVKNDAGRQVIAEISE